MEMERKILAVQEAERRRIARDIHDGPAQSLAAVLLQLNFLTAEPITNNTEELRQELLRLKGIAQDSMNEMRQILFDLKPVRQNNDSLLSVLEDYFAEIKAKYNFCIELNSRGVPQIYPPYIQTALFRLVQESVNNCRKHAGVNKVHIMLAENREQIEILIEDAGKGFDKTGELNKADNFGIAGMLERTALLGGTIEIESKPGAGTQILIIIPLNGEVL